MGPAPAPHADVASAVLDMLRSQQGGGLPGLAQAFQQKGLGDVMSSWVGTGQNLPISQDQVQHALPGDMLSQISQKLGISPAVAASALTVVLPMVVDKLTPHGNVPQQHSLLRGRDRAAPEPARPSLGRDPFVRTRPRRSVRSDGGWPPSPEPSC